MATKTHDVLADLGSYTGKDGQEKKRWLRVGAAFDNGSIKLDAVPVGPGWSGWLLLREPTPFQPQNREPPRSDDEPPF